jgi:ABC-type transporter Mla subunit MlaD
MAQLSDKGRNALLNAASAVLQDEVDRVTAKAEQAKKQAEDNARKDREALENVRRALDEMKAERDGHKQAEEAANERIRVLNANVEALQKALADATKPAPEPQQPVKVQMPGLMAKLRKDSPTVAAMKAKSEAAKAKL